ncbi:MAG TPA: YeaH/YhbH family protein [Vicinamibacterales bacterium]|nr:YeaH/YhbH family protein [Vicinamibacterales bacterium]
MSHLIDRRENARGKSAVNRERFLRRYKTQISAAVHKMIGERRLADMERGGDVPVPRKDISEPSFGFGHGGDREIILPGNRDYVAGDRIPRPDGSLSGGGAETGHGESEDAFVFSLSREEFMHIFFDDLELPHLARTMLGRAVKPAPIRAGYTTTGAPAQLALVRTLSHSLARRIALRSGIVAEAESVQAEFARAVAAGQQKDAFDLYAELQRLSRRGGALPFLEELDLRYRNRVMRPEPVARAAMFCLMDVSASMDEEKKDLAKRFFTLLYLFLTRKYNEVELIFVRHTDDAEEVDENTFFHDPRSGGTIVLSALELAEKIRRERYADGWNVYAAQASDGDAFGSDPARSARYLREQLLPHTRYYTYLELTGQESHERMSTLWMEYQVIASATDNFAMRRAAQRDQIYPVFHDLFRKDMQ